MPRGWDGGGVGWGGGGERFSKSQEYVTEGNDLLNVFASDVRSNL